MTKFEDATLQKWCAICPEFAKELLELMEKDSSVYRELHIHTEGSYRDAVSKIPELFERTKELGRNAIAITDHGNMTRTFEAFKYATKMQKKAFQEELEKSGADEGEIAKLGKAFGSFGNILNPEDEKLKALVVAHPKEAAKAVMNSVKFIPGIETYVQGPENENSAYHLILLAKDWQGVQAIFKVTNLAQLNMGGKLEDLARVTLESLERFIGPGSEGYGHVIATSACMSGHLSSLLLSKYNLRMKISKTQEQIDGLEIVFPSDALDLAKAELEDAKTELAELKERLKAVKALANKKIASKIERLKAKVEKMNAKALDTSNEEMELDALYSQAMVIEDAKAQLNDLTAEVALKTSELSEMKARYTQKEKAIAPQLKLEAKIRAYEEELASLPNEYLAAKEMAEKYDYIFGHGNYYIELQNHGIDEEFTIEAGLRRIAAELDIPLTVANDVHFCRKEDEHKRNLISSMRFNTPISKAESQVGNDQLYLKSDEEMLEAFPGDEDILRNTIDIANKCNVFYIKEMHLPVYSDDVNGYDPEKYLREKCKAGFRKRYPNAKKLWPADVFKAYGERINYELGIIHKMGFDSYIAIVEDFIAYGRDTYGQLLVGPGRGSGAGSLVCYLLGITDIDPMRYGLIFERFLNPERVSMPK